MSEIFIKLSLQDIIKILESLNIDSFESNKKLLQKIMNQLGRNLAIQTRLKIPPKIKERFWDRFHFFVEKLNEK